MSATTPPTDNLVPRTDREQAAYREGVADGRAYAARDSAPTAEPALTDEQIDRLARQHLGRMTRPFYTKWKDGIDIDYPVIEVVQFARAVLAAAKAVQP